MNKRGTRWSWLVIDGADEKFNFCIWKGYSLFVHIWCSVSCQGLTRTIQVPCEWLGTQMKINGKCQKCGKRLHATISFVDYEEKMSLRCALEKVHFLRRHMKWRRNKR